MRTRITLFVLALAAIAAAVFTFAPRDRSEDLAPIDDGRPAVAATIFPLYDIVRNVAGDGIRTELLLPAGANPHTYEPSPSAMRRIGGTEVIYAIGHGLDDWALALREETRSGYVAVDTNVALREAVEMHADEGAEEEEEHGPIDPHYWLDASNAILIAKTVRDDLLIRFPDQADAIRANHDRYAAELAALDAELRAAFAAAGTLRIVTLHDAWGYFADAYGIEIIGTYEPSAAREPTPAYLAELSEAIAASGSRALFSEPGAALGTLATFAADNRLEIRELDPEGGGVPGRMSYIELMRFNAEVLLGKEEAR
jgi:zinc transport system substrate-binding protein